MKAGVWLSILLASSVFARALVPSLELAQYAHTAWTARNGFSVGNIYALAQTPDGYLWFGTEFSLFRFNGVRSVPWPQPAGQHLPDKNINSMLVTRDGTLWIGTFFGLVTWSGGKLTWRPEPELRRQFVASPYEDREGNGVGRHSGGSRPAVRNPKRRHAVLRGGRRLRQRRLGFV